VPWLAPGAITAIALGAVGALLALLWDTARRWHAPRRCPRCWYAMDGTPGLTCPECGRAARTERALHRHRRRWRVAVLGVLVILAGGATLASRFVTSTMVAPLLPEWALVRITTDPRPYAEKSRWNPTPPSPYQVELWNRYRAGRLSLAARRTIAADQLGAKPPMLVHSRPSWPVGVPLELLVSWQMYSPVAHEIEAVARLPDASPVVAYEPGNAYTRLALFRSSDDYDRWTVGTPDVPADGVVFDIVVREGGREVWRGVQRFPIAIGASVDEVITPVSGPAPDAMVRGALIGRTSLLFDDPALVIEPTEPTEVPRPALALRLEVLDGAEVVGTARALVPVYQYSASDRRKFESGSDIFRRAFYEGPLVAPVRGDPDAFQARFLEDATLVVRITGDRALALRDPDADSYWSGTLEIPLDVLLGPASGAASP